MRNAELEDSQAGIKIAGRNISNMQIYQNMQIYADISAICRKIRYADDATLMAQIEEKLKSLLMKVKEECWPKTHISKN